ncbi:MAG: penicillin-binding protein 2 [Actinomycetota bacterium]
MVIGDNHDDSITDLPHQDTMVQRPLGSDHSGRPGLRLLGVAVLVGSLMVTLAARLFTVQILGADDYRVVSSNAEREIVTPAVRGLILDDQGRPLVGNRSALVVSVSRTTLLDSADEGRDLIKKLAQILDEPFEKVWGRTQLCGTRGAPKQPVCYNGSPYQPVPVAQDVSPEIALWIAERAEQFPGVEVELQAIRTLPQPDDVAAPHLLGYLGPVTDAELKADSQAARDGRIELQRTDLIGRAGLEKQYDDDLRGVAGVSQVEVDPRGRIVEEQGKTEPVPGNHLVTSIDARVQAAAERALVRGIAEARKKPDPGGRPGLLKADSGAVVVMDVRTGQVIAMASYPSYDPNIWVDGITNEEYASLTDESAGTPLISRATQGLFPPASAFKVVTLPAAVQSGYDLDGRYQCGSSYTVGGRAFRNYESLSFGMIDLTRALAVSCDTIFYKFAYETWLRQGGNKAVNDKNDPFVQMARAFGLGKPTGIDLPDDVAGRVPGREWKQDYWEATKESSCRRGKTGYPEIAQDDPTRAKFLQQLAKENCVDGYIFRGGDAANFSIGQGDVSVSPLQMARVYAAVANGGTLWEPHVGKAVVSPRGELVREIKPKVSGKVPLRADVQKFLRSALREVNLTGTGRGVFGDFPVAVSGKTGTGEVYGKQSTSWYASFAPSDNPQYAVVAVVSQGGTGSGTTAPIVKDVYSAIYGVQDDNTLRPDAAFLPGGKPPKELPTIRSDGSLITPEGVVPATEGLPASGVEESSPTSGSSSLSDQQGKP